MYFTCVQTLRTPCKNEENIKQEVSNKVGDRTEH